MCVVIILTLMRMIARCFLLMVMSAMISSMGVIVINYVTNDVINDLIDEGYCGRLEGGDLLP